MASFSGTDGYHHPLGVLEKNNELSTWLAQAIRPGDDNISIANLNVDFSQ